MIPGNDLSPFQPNPDFPAYFRGGERFTVLKVNEGAHWPQSVIDWFVRNRQHALDAGFVVGQYAYLDNSTGGADAYRRARAICGGKELIWGDVEYNPKVPQMPDGEVHAFHAAQIRDIGQSGVYGLQSTVSRFPEALWWVAAWGRTSPAHKWTLWQKGADGFGLDGDEFNGDAAALAALFGGGEQPMTKDEIAKEFGYTSNTPGNDMMEDLAAGRGARLASDQSVTTPPPNPISAYVFKAVRQAAAGGSGALPPGTKLGVPGGVVVE